MQKVAGAADVRHDGTFSYHPRFFAGILTFLAPCTLPLVPGYLGFISGLSSEDANDSVKLKTARRNIFLNGLFFVFGFSAVFVIMGILVGFAGATALAPYRIWLARISGVVIVFFGLFLLNILTIPFLMREKRLEPSSFKQKGRLFHFLRWVPHLRSGGRHA